MITEQITLEEKKFLDKIRAEKIAKNKYIAEAQKCYEDIEIALNSMSKETLCLMETEDSRECRIVKNISQLMFELRVHLGHRTF